MKAYGFKRKDMLRCRYGCCGYKGVKERDGSQLIAKASRKRARSNDKFVILSALNEMD